MHPCLLNHPLKGEPPMLGSSGPRKSRVPSLRQARRARLRVEELEARNLLTLLSPVMVRHLYGFDQATFGGGLVPADGAGQTIAIVDAYDHPNIDRDLAAF